MAQNQTRQTRFRIMQHQIFGQSAQTSHLFTQSKSRTIADTPTNIMLIEDSIGTTNPIIAKGLQMELKSEITAEGSNDTGLPPIDH